MHNRFAGRPYGPAGAATARSCCRRRRPTAAGSTGIFAAASRHFDFALTSASVTFGLFARLLQPCSATDRAVESLMSFVASRHRCSASATLPPDDVVDAVLDAVELEPVELDPPEELPQALSARTTTSTGARNSARRIMPPSLRFRRRFGAGPSVRLGQQPVHQRSGRARLDLRPRVEAVAEQRGEQRHHEVGGVGRLGVERAAIHASILSSIGGSASSSSGSLPVPA